MNMKYFPIVGAAFLVVAMAIQFLVSYRSEKERVIESIDMEIKLAEKDFFFEIYDIQAAGEEMMGFVRHHMDDKDRIQQQTRITLHRYPDVLACYVSFRPGYYDDDDYWYCPCSWRKADSIVTKMYGDEEHDYFQSKWYNGALEKDSKGYWSSSYRDEDFLEPICTHSVRVDDDGELVCVIGLDFSMIWLDNMLEEIKPLEEAYCLLYSSDGTVMLTSDNMTNWSQIDDDMIVRSSLLSPVDMRLEIGVPVSYVWRCVRQKSWITFIVLLFGILIAGLLIRRIWKNQEDYTRVETENKVIEKELHVASRIQRGILREGEREKVKNDNRWTDVDMEAALVPMREVGGDLYDFYRKGDDLYFIIGDVSGKGIPAAMFMSATVNLFRSAVRRLQSPRAIMEELNGVLSDNNPSFMFVTALIGRLHVPTGELLYCNAGHLAPIKVQSGKEQRAQMEKSARLNLTPNIPLGYDDSFRYQEQGAMLGEGDTLVLYTDGITEARNETREMLGMTRWTAMVEQIQIEHSPTAKELLEQVKAYIGKAEQADDITLMTIHMLSRTTPLTLRVENRMDQWSALRTALHNYCMCAGMESRSLKRLEVATEEAVVNIIHYSQATWIELRSERRIADSEVTVAITLSDNGVAFDPTAQAEVDTAQTAADRQIGGLGIALVRQIADQVSYRRINETNELTIIKNI